MPDRASSWARGHAYVVIALALGVLFVVTYAVAAALQVPWLADPRGYLDNGNVPVAALGIALLTADVLIPVPSSGVMIANGAAFGLVVGSVLSLIGGTCATAAGYLVGSRSQRLVDRFVDAEQHERAAELLRRHGVWAIIVTRPVPVLSETVGVLAGVTAALPWWKATLAGAAGSLIPAIAYAAAGDYATSFGNSLLVFTGVMVMAFVVWLVQRPTPEPNDLRAPTSPGRPWGLAWLTVTAIVLIMGVAWFIDDTEFKSRWVLITLAAWGITTLGGLVFSATSETRRSGAALLLAALVTAPLVVVVTFVSWTAQFT